MACNIRQLPGFDLDSHRPKAVPPVISPRITRKDRPVALADNVILLNSQDVSRALTQRVKDVLTIWEPSQETYETLRSYVIEIDLPGVPPDTFEVVVAGVVLIVRGSRERKLRENARSIKCTRSFGTFCCSFVLPPNARLAQLTAEFELGVLTVTVPIGAPIVGEPPKSPPSLPSTPIPSSPEMDFETGQLTPLSVFGGIGCTTRAESAVQNGELTPPSGLGSPRPFQSLLLPRRNNPRRNRRYSTCGPLQVIDRLKEPNATAFGRPLGHSLSAMTLPSESLAADRSAVVAARPDASLDWLDPATTVVGPGPASSEARLARRLSTFSARFAPRLRLDSSSSDLSAEGLSLTSTGSPSPMSDDTEIASSEGVVLPPVPVAKGDVALTGTAVVSMCSTS